MSTRGTRGTRKHEELEETSHEPSAQVSQLARNRHARADRL